MPVSRSIIISVLAIGTAAALVSGVSASENSCGPQTPAEEQLVRLQQENEILNRKIRDAEAVKSVSIDQLRRKKAQRLKDIAVDVRSQRQTTSDFETFVKWMTANLASYNKYLQAGSYAAMAARVLPIPYAGQASVFAKFVAQFTVALNESSAAVTGYLNSTQRFLALTDAIDLQRPLNGKEIDEAALYADQKLLKDMNDAQQKLASVAELSGGALSFLESLNHYVSGTDEYWNKVKGVFKKDIDPKEKSFISENTANLRNQAARFNGKLKTFDDLGRKETSGIKALAVYDELIAESR